MNNNVKRLPRTSASMASTPNVDFIFQVLLSVQGIIAGEPCYICPTKAVAYTAEAGYWCDVGGVPKGDSNDETSEFSTQALCESNSGKWTVYSCGDAHQTFLQAGNARRGSNAEVIRSGHATCTQFQGFYADKCCVDGSAPPNTTGFPSMPRSAI